jgi:hypothetical protein
VKRLQKFFGFLRDAVSSHQFVSFAKLMWKISMPQDLVQTVYFLVNRLLAHEFIFEE